MAKLINTLALITLSAASSLAYGAGIDDPVLSHLVVDDLSVQLDETEHWSLELHGWIGQDLDKFHYDVSANNEGNASYIAYGFAADPYWDLLFGVGYEQFEVSELVSSSTVSAISEEHKESQTWAQVGFMGIAPYYVESELWFKASSDGQLAIEAQFEHEIMLTQQWALVPEASIVAYGKNKPALYQGSGMAEAEFELSLRYEFSREFAVFAKYSYESLYGKTKSYHLLQQLPTSEKSFRIGFRFWL